ncbi:MAG: hypothetical protein ACREMA_13640 [Longimicrobiales bacterium]
MPVIVGVTVSLTDTVRGPAVLSTTAKKPWPLLSAESGGKAAAGSVLVKWMLPE